MLGPRLPALLCWPKFKTLKDLFPNWNHVFSRLYFTTCRPLSASVNLRVWHQNMHLIKKNLWHYKISRLFIEIPDLLVVLLTNCTKFETFSRPWNAFCKFKTFSMFQDWHGNSARVLVQPFVTDESWKNPVFQCLAYYIILSMCGCILCINVISLLKCGML